MQRQAHTRETILTIVAVGLTAFLAVTGVCSAEGQQLRKMPPIGLLVYGNPPPAPSQEQQVIEGLRDLGWVDGQTMRLVIRYAEGRPERLPALTRELVEARVDLIVGVGTDVAKVVRSVTDTLPLVMSVSEDPVEIGLVASLSRPGGNLTGVTFISAELAAKRLELLKEVVPQAARVAVLWNPAHVDLEFKELALAGRAFGITLQSVEVRSPEEWDGAFRAVVSARADALVVVPSRMINHNAKRIAAFALEQRLPTVSLWRLFTEAGGLMSYGPNIGAMVRRTAAHVDKILKGVKPGDLPIERPTHFELVINLKTAQALGVTIVVRKNAVASPPSHDEHHRAASRHHGARPEPCCALKGKRSTG